MEIKSLEVISTLTLEGLYDLHTGYYDQVLNLRVFEFTLEDRHSGRLWLVSNDIYGVTDNVDVLCTFNGIYNPLTIMSGQNLYYVHSDDIPAVTNVQNQKAIQSAIANLPNLNTGKNQKVDPNRTIDKSKQQLTQKAKVLVPSPNLAKNTSISFGNGNITLLPNF